MKYLITLMIQDGERRYYKYFSKESENRELLRKDIKEEIEEYGCFEIEQEIYSIEPINKQEHDVLMKFGVI